ncbi:MAG: DUF742 domain-containing protein [Acidimicrobiales bacterium]
MSPRHVDPTPEDDGPSLVRPYALVRGRTRAGTAAPIPVEAVVVTVLLADRSELVLEPAAIARLCERPHGIAEISAILRVPVGVIRVLVGDLASEGYVLVNLPPDPHADGAVDRVLLERVLAGLEAL